MKTESKKQQPAGLKFLFLTEMWERFGYYAVMSLLVLFMTQHLHMNDSSAYGIFGAFGALIFVSPVIGGWLADRFLGYVPSIIIGALLLSIGYFVLSLGHANLFVIAMSILVLGNGFFKPNISSLLGTFYGSKEETQRESGFLIFYVGINVGGMLGVILCGFIAKIWGWPVAFFTAGCGLLFGLAIFLIGLNKIKKSALTASNKPLLKTIFFITVCGACLIPALWELINHPGASNLFLDLFVLVLLGIFGIIALRSDRVQRQKLLVCLVLIMFSIAFWALYQQGPMSLTLFVKRDVNRHLLGMTIPSSVIWTLNGIFLVLLAPIVVKIENILERRGVIISTPTKFALGICLMGLGYLLLVLASRTVSVTHQASLWWITSSYGIQTLGELLLSPIGLAMITALAPKNLCGLLMGTWFFSLAAATAIAGQLAKLASLPNDHLSNVSSAAIYGHAFADYGWMAVGVSILLWVLVPKLKCLMDS